MYELVANFSLSRTLHSTRGLVTMHRRVGRHAFEFPKLVAWVQGRRYSRSRTAFIDRTTVTVKAGNGGPGCSSFARGPNQEYAPPDGGNGGAGGSVWIEATSQCTSLRMASTKLRAQSGGAGMSAKRRGKKGEDLIVRVPPGTVVKELPLFRQEFIEEQNFSPGNDDVSPNAAAEREEVMVIAELNAEGQRAELARGGLGGRGNCAYKNSQNRSPVNFDAGESGQTRRLELELKGIADVGLVGLPNAGKSTFLRAISQAKPKVASYPFTTLRPHIGVVAAKSPEDALMEKRITVADIPGLIEGAHNNRGLGHEFLRHIERTKFLVYVLDLSAEDAGMLHDLSVLRNELELHSPGLSERKSCIVANKMDSGVVAHDNLKVLVHEVGESMDVYPTSAKYKSGTEDVVRHLFDRLVS